MQNTVQRLTATMRKLRTAKTLPVTCFAVALAALATTSRTGASPIPVSVPSALADETVDMSVVVLASAVEGSDEPGPAAEGVSWLHGTAANNRIDGDANDNVIDGYAGRDVLHGFAGVDHIFGGEGNDLLIGGGGDDVLNGGEGNDRVVGGEGSDQLSGAAGDDVLDGGQGDDTYLFEPGFGHDTVRERAREHGGHDVLVFQHLRASDVRLERSADDLKVSDPQHGDSVLIVGFFAADHRSVETLRFSDGWSISPASLTEGPRLLSFTAQ